jgi:hypothetical protein
MKRLIIICEGETEQEFCAQLLREHLLNFNIYIELPTTKKSGGDMLVGERFIIKF